MQTAWGQSARALIDRAFALAVERGARVTTLHLAAAMMEEAGDGARFLTARGLRATDLRTAVKNHAEEPGTFERVQSTARRIAASRAAEASPVHLLVAALGDGKTALASMVAQLGCDPITLADEALRAASRTARVGSSPGVIIHSGNAKTLAAQRSDARAEAGAPARTEARADAARTEVRVDAGSDGARMPAVNAPGARDVPEAGVAARVMPTRPAAGRAHGARVEKTEHDVESRTFPAVYLLARNLSAEGVRGVLDPVVGRDPEVRRVLDAVARREGRGALVVGPPGVGKSTLLRAVARAPGTPTVLSLRHAEVAAQARGPQGAERSRRLVEELVKLGDRCVVALDPIAPWFLTRDMPDEVVLELRAALAAGRLAWIGTATSDEARRLADAEPWLERAAMRVELDEPDAAALRGMVRAFAPAISTYHGVVADAPVLEHAAALSERYLAGRAQPDRALSVVDLALARARRARVPALSREVVAEVVAELGGLPLDRVAATDGQRLLALEAHLGERVVGHAEARARVGQTLRRNAVGFRGARPIGTFLFLGPTGVGKTETAKAIAEALFPGAGALSRFDMAEYAEGHAVARLVGAPPGYVGHADGGQLTEAVRRRPYQLVLLDEIEKAHRDVLESLLGLLDEGRLTDGRGRTVDFCNTVVVMTSNLGAELYDPRGGAGAGRAIGFGSPGSHGGLGAGGAGPTRADRASLAERVRDAARAALPPELWNRIDEPVVFGALSRDEVSEIARRLLRQSFARLEAERGVRTEATAAVVDLLLDNGGFEPSLGARPMRRAIARLVEAPIAEAVLRGALKAGDTARLEVRDWGIEVVPEAR